ncbi:hypothetical protein GWL_12990 [Herbaspirillum sp. GW103]|nr:hypothetical protein GWL_12990 [Herbaspirillum sp. GW103]
MGHCVAIRVGGVSQDERTRRACRCHGQTLRMIKDFAPANLPEMAMNLL